LTRVERHCDCGYCGDRFHGNAIKAQITKVQLGFEVINYCTKLRCLQWAVHRKDADTIMNNFMTDGVLDDLIGNEKVTIMIPSDEGK